MELTDVNPTPALGLYHRICFFVGKMGVIMIENMVVGKTK